jgi:hypothetical protein
METILDILAPLEACADFSVSLSAGSFFPRVHAAAGAGVYQCMDALIVKAPYIIGAIVAIGGTFALRRRARRLRRLR